MAVAFSVALAAGAPTQAYAVGWADGYFDTRSGDAPCLEIAAARDGTAILRVDGRLFMQGSNALPAPALPHGVTYTDVATEGHLWHAAVRSDGAIEQWGSPPGGLGTIPANPPGVRFTQVAVAFYAALALRSDGQVTTWGWNPGGTFTAPTPPPGTSFVEVDIGLSFAVGLLSDGRALAWGYPSGATAVPALPPGTTYVEVAAGMDHNLLLRSDGQLIAIGDNSQGQCNVPPLPSGLTYTRVAAGDYHSFARLSNGAWVAWGDNHFGQCNVPTPPAGLLIVDVDGGRDHSVSRLSDGSMLGWGWNGRFAHTAPRIPQGQHATGASGHPGHVALLTSNGQIHGFGIDLASLIVPSLPAGTTYVGLVTGDRHHLAWRSDGGLVAWGYPYPDYGQRNVPPLPPGLRYVKAAGGRDHSLALRSDGQVVHFGRRIALGSQPDVPALPAGMTYVDVAASTFDSLFLRSDGHIVGVGSGAGLAPFPPTGRRFVKVAAMPSYGLGLLSDGTLRQWGFQNGLPVTVPTLPPGVVYLDVAGGMSAIARRSDGEIVVWGGGASTNTPRPLIDPGTTCYAIDADDYLQFVAVYGPTSTYATVANGCAGSLPTTRLIPLDTPHIGKTLSVRIDSLPVDMAFLAFGWNRLPAPVDLAPVGMPGCNVHLQIDTAALVTGSSREAQFDLAIPLVPGLVGLRFHHQALVLDPTFGNALGAVVSDLAEAVIGK